MQTILQRQLTQATAKMVLAAPGLQAKVLTFAVGALVVAAMDFVAPKTQAAAVEKFMGWAQRTGA